MEKQLHFPRGTIIKLKGDYHERTIYNNYKNNYTLNWNEKDTEGYGWGWDIKNIEVVKLGCIPLEMVEIY